MFSLHKIQVLVKSSLGEKGLTHVKMLFVVLNLTCSKGFEQIARPLEFKLQPKVFVEYSSTLRAL